MKPNGNRRHRQRRPGREAQARCRHGPAAATMSAIDVMYHARHALKPRKGARNTSCGNKPEPGTAPRWRQQGGIDGGGGRNRTGVHGFAGRCITTLPPRRVTWMLDCSRCRFRVPERPMRQHRKLKREALLPFRTGAGNESCTRALSLCFPITFSTVVISEDLNYSLVFRPRQQSSSSGIHQRPRTFQPPRRCTRNHPAPAASTYRIATATEAGTDPR